MNLESKIEAILFWKGEPVSVKKLADSLKVSTPEVQESLELLKASLEGRGVAIQENGDEVMLVTARDYSLIISELQKEELKKDLSKASLETISIILYKNGASRGEIDYIRGVNSSFILRALAVRGLIQKTLDPKDNRRMIFKPSFDLLSFMGVESVSQLPNFSEVNNSINSAAETLEDLSQKEELQNGGSNPQE